MTISSWQLDHAKYKQQSYWQERFSNEAHYEWLGDFRKFSSVLLPYIKECDRILHIGCGNSRLSLDLFDRGYRHITNVDYERDVIAKLCHQYQKSHPEMRWLPLDIRAMGALESESFDVVIEKATIDTLLVGEKSQWEISSQGEADLDATCGHVSRLLANAGRFVSITFAQPHFRLPHLAKRDYHWSIKVHQFGSEFHYFAFVMTKGEPLNLKELEPYLYSRRQEQESSAANPKFVDFSESGSNWWDNFCEFDNR